MFADVVQELVAARAVRSRMTVTNGGPAWTEPVASKQPIPNSGEQIFIERPFPLDDINRASRVNAARHYLCVILRMRPSAGSIRYAVSPLPATTPRAPFTVGTSAFR